MLRQGSERSMEGGVCSWDSSHFREAGSRGNRKYNWAVRPKSSSNKPFLPSRLIT